MIFKEDFFMIVRFMFKPNIIVFFLIALSYCMFHPMYSQEILNQTALNERDAGRLRTFDRFTHAILDSFIYTGSGSELNGSLYRIHDIARHPDGSVYAPHDSSLVELKLENNGFEPILKIPYSEEYKDSLAYSYTIIDTVIHGYVPPFGLCTDHLGRFYMGSIRGIDPEDWTSFVFRYDPVLDTTELLFRIPGKGIDDLEFWNGKLIAPSRLKGEIIWAYDIYSGELDSLTAWNHEWGILNLSNDATPCGTDHLYVYKGHRVYTYEMESGAVSTWESPHLKWGAAGGTSSQSYYGSLPNMRIDSVSVTGGLCDSVYELTVHIPPVRQAGAIYSIDGSSYDSLATLLAIDTGAHIIEIIDTFGCFWTDTLFIPASTSDLILATIDTPQCSLEEGRMELRSRLGLIELSIDRENWSHEIIVEALDATSYTVYSRYFPGCLDSIVYDFSPLELLQVTAMPMAANCGEADGSVEIEVQGGTAPYLYVLDVDTFFTPLISGLEKGQYSLTIIDADGCGTTQSVQVDGNQPDLIDSIKTLSSPCDRSLGQIIVHSYESDVLFSLPGIEENEIGVFDSLPIGQYVLWAVDSMGCRDSMSIDLRGFTELSIYQIDCSLNVSDTSTQWNTGSLCDTLFRVIREAVQLDGELIADFSGSHGDTVEYELIFGGSLPVEYEIIWDDRLEVISMSEFRGRLIQPQEGEYGWSIVIGDSCTTDHLFSVPQSLDEIYIPNVFSPNGDQVNDVWRIHARTESNISAYNLSVYDRYGNQVYQAEGQNLASVGWDGLVKMQEAASSVYVYVLKYIRQGETYIKSGDLTLLR